MSRGEGEDEHGWGVHTETLGIGGAGDGHGVAVVVLVHLGCVPSVDGVGVPGERCERGLLAILVDEHGVGPIGMVIAEAVAAVGNHEV